MGGGGVSRKTMMWGREVADWRESGKHVHPWFSLNNKRVYKSLSTNETLCLLIKFTDDNFCWQENDCEKHRHFLSWKTNENSFIFVDLTKLTHTLCNVQAAFPKKIQIDIDSIILRNSVPFSSWHIWESFLLSKSRQLPSTTKNREQPGTLLKFFII